MKSESQQFSCKLTSSELQKRKDTIIADLKAMMFETDELPNGINIKFESTDLVLDKLNEFIKSERQCCDFFHFQITVEENVAWLKIYGAEGTREFLHKELGF